MKHFRLLLSISLFMGLSAYAQPKYNLKELCTEQLNRGVVATRTPDGKVAVSWRILRDDQKQEAFDVYRNGVRLTHQPLTKGGSFFLDEHPLQNEDAVYEVRVTHAQTTTVAPVGQFTLCADAPVGYLSLQLQKPEGGKVPVMQGAATSQNRNHQGRQRWQWRDTGEYSYTANDASVADVDGDGQYEMILKWEPTNARDNSHDGYTGPTLFDCYRLDGTLLWRINMGPNIRSGAHYVPFIVYDFDGDGRAELMVKTAPGTTDASGSVISDSGVPSAAPASSGSPVSLVPCATPASSGSPASFVQCAASLSQQSSTSSVPSVPDYRSPQGRILSGPEFISVFDGLTGRVLDTKPYIPERGNLAEWGDTRGNRSERYLAALGYLGPSPSAALASSGSPAVALASSGSPASALASSPSPSSALASCGSPAGKKSSPSALFCRGYYTRTVIAAWDWDGKSLTNRWVFDTNTPEWRSYAGQGNHNLRVADVDGDGYDELTYGSMAVDNDGRGLYNTGFGHGDALHLMAFDPSSDNLQVWDCHENKRDGSDFRDAKTGKVLFQIKSRTDVGRAMAADIDPTNFGVEMWSTDSHGIRNIKGEVVSTAKDPDDPQHDNTLVINGRYLPVNFGIWWDGDLLRELLDHETVWKYNWTTKTIDLQQKFEGVFNNGTKSNPCLSADILGDWREEVIIRNRESTELRIYTTTIPTDYRINCLMQDIPYRLSVATENVGYNQPPAPSFYLGPDRTDYLK